MKNIIISTDSTCELPIGMLQQRNISRVHLHYYLDGVEQDNTMPFDGQRYYTAMDSGADASTSLCNVAETQEMFERLLAEGKDVVHIAFSSALSGSCHNAVIAAEAVNATSTNKVYVVDSLTGCGGLGILTLMADDYANTGKSAIEVRDYVESIKMNMCGFFCLSTVKYVIRGGRVAKLASLIASAMNIRLFLHVSKRGKLVVLNKTFSRKKTLQSIINGTIAKYNGMNSALYVSHAICPEDAQFVANGVYEGIGVMPTIIELGPIFGSHGGKGALAVFFTGTDRDKL